MNGTNNATGGSRRTTPAGLSLHWRLAGWTVLVLLGAALIIWIKTSTWRQLARLQREFAAVKVESYYLGIRLRSGLDQLNSALLRFQLSKAEPAVRDAFHAEGRRLGQLIEHTRPRLGSALEGDLVTQAEQALKTYLTEAQPLLEREPRAVRRDSAAQAYSEIERLAAPLATVCDRLVAVQHQSWEQFVNDSEQALDKLRLFSQISVLSLLVLGCAILLLVYAVAVTPLRRRLNRTQSLMERQEKMASLGTLATGVAHEIRNPLTAIKCRLFSLKQGLPAELGQNEDAEVIGQEINRLERIVKDFLQFARPSEPSPTRIAGEHLLQSVRSLLAPELEKASIQLLVEAADNVWLEADKPQLEQVLINLVQNAADSIRRNGTVSLRLKQGAARLAGRSTPAVILEVADTGTGIPVEVQKRLFDPFFSTKEGGTGLGLSIAEGIVRKHGGQLLYQTQLNRGTTFQVVLPSSSNHAGKNSAH